MPVEELPPPEGRSTNDLDNPHQFHRVGGNTLPHPNAPRQPSIQHGEAPGQEPAQSASAYLERSDAPMAPPAAPAGRAVQAQPGAAPSAAPAPGANAHRVISGRPRGVQLLHQHFGLRGVSTDEYPLVNGLSVLFRPVGPEDELWAHDQIVGYDFVSAEARQRAFEFAIVSIATAGFVSPHAETGAPERRTMMDFLGIDEAMLTGIPIQDPFCPPTAIRYRCATELFAMMMGDGNNALNSDFATLMRESYFLFQQKELAQRPHRKQAEAMRVARERSLLTKKEEETRTPPPPNDAPPSPPLSPSGAP